MGGPLDSGGTSAANKDATPTPRASSRVLHPQNRLRRISSREAVRADSKAYVISKPLDSLNGTAFQASEGGRAGVEPGI